MGDTITLCLTFWGTANLFCTAAAPFCIPANNVQRFQFLHNLANSCYLLFFFFFFFFDSSQPNGMCLAFLWAWGGRYLTAVLTYISLVIGDGAHLFMCYWSIWRLLTYWPKQAWRQGWETQFLNFSGLWSSNQQTFIEYILKRSPNPGLGLEIFKDK